MFDHDDHDGLEAALAFGTGYAFYRHGQDQQTRDILNGLAQAHSAEPQELDIHVHLDDDEFGPVEPINAVDFSTVDLPKDFNDFIGQEPLKRQLMIYVASAQKRGQRLPHMLFASGFPGVGKTTVARLCAKLMGVDIYELVPPFKLGALVQAAQELEDGDILFIDEIHKLAEGGKRGAEFLLKMLEDGVIFMPDGEVIELADITVIGATTDKDMLPEPVIDRFKVKPYFQAYSIEDLSCIAVKFAARHTALDSVTDECAAHMALACRGTPRILEEMVMAAQALHDATGVAPDPGDVLQFLEIEPDGLTRTHIHYLTALRQYFARTKTDTEEIEYIVGEAAIQQILRETKPGLQRVEGFLVERGLIDRTPRGRRLTEAGIQRAEEFIAQGKGASDVA